jgi:deoxyribodipyrimidine photo-lyase
VTAVAWFRRDLRVHDHPALREALRRHDRVIPVLCLDDRILAGRHRSGPRTQFMLECLVDLDAALRKRNSGLVIRRGDPAEEIPALCEEVGAAEVHASLDVTPFAVRRDERVRAALRGRGTEARMHPGVGAVDDVGAVLTAAGRPYTVFSPFWRSWIDEPRRDVLAAPRKLPALPSRLAKGRLPSLASLGLEQELSDPPRGGEKAARERLARFLSGPIHGYADDRDSLGRERTSRLSPYLHFGCISAREAEERLPRGQGPDAFRRQLCWRDFHHHVLLHFPGNAHSELQERYRGRIRWSRSRTAFEAWCEGRTGFPLVDAGMRQLRREGWMHNRARLVVGSFLTKDLGIDWRRGESWFMRMLVDGDEANNNGNWQWIASVGVDPQPPFRRIYNPARHQERYDPDNAYVRRHVAELRAVPDEYMREPWTMPEEVQLESRCMIGRDYPAPIVDHREAREAALRRLRLA